jgi:hypothetical protein
MSRLMYQPGHRRDFPSAIGQAHPHQLGLHTEAHQVGWARVVDAVHPILRGLRRIWPDRLVLNQGFDIATTREQAAQVLIRGVATS